MGRITANNIVQVFHLRCFSMLCGATHNIYERDAVKAAEVANKLGWTNIARVHNYCPQCSEEYNKTYGTNTKKIQNQQSV